MQIDIENVTKHYGKKQVLKGVSFSAGAGECIGIIGKNGSGKSTLLSTLAGVIKPSTGTFTADGENLFLNDKLRKESVAYVPQGTPLIEALSAKDNLRMWYSKDAMQESLSNGFLKVLGIDEYINVTVSKMSGGMKKRLSIGCAINSNPSILLLDEPSAALDLICREAIYDYFNAFIKKGGTLILATHEIREIEMCDKCFLLKDGVLSKYDYDGNVAALAGLL